MHNQPPRLVCAGLLMVCVTCIPIARLVFTCRRFESGDYAATYSAVTTGALSDQSAYKINVLTTQEAEADYLK